MGSSTRCCAVRWRSERAVVCGRRGTRTRSDASFPFEPLRLCAGLSLALVRPHLPLLPSSVTLAAFNLDDVSSALTTAHVPS